MKKIKSLLIAGCTTLVLSQCATQDEVRKLNYQLRTVNQKVKEVQSTTANQMQKRTASAVNKLDAVAEETRQLRALNEENQQAFELYRRQSTERVAALQAALEQMRTENEVRFKAIEHELDQLTGNLQRVSKARVQAAEKRARAAARRAEEAQRTVLAAGSHTGAGVVLHPENRKIRKNHALAEPAARKTEQAAPSVAPPVARQTAPVKQPVVAAAPAAPTGGSSLLGQAMASFKNRKYKTAYKTFEQVLAGNPKAAEAAQTLFYMGECLFNTNEYDLAILDYQKVISNYPKDVHSPAALLRQGMSFEKLTDLETAKIIYAKLTTDYPKSREAGTARKRAANL
jgi:tol-pal system protein YbgF